jgi:protoporphyrinogen oxidase
MKICILGAGIAGLACSYRLKGQGVNSIVFESRSTWGGLCDNFEIKGYRFDRFIHLSFSKSDYVNNLFLKHPHYKHKPLAYNYADGYWLKHPVQNNLYPLPEFEKNKIIESFMSIRPQEASSIDNYEAWLRAQYGDYFAEIYPLRYTKKYWAIMANQLETKWVGGRMSTPSIDEVMYGATHEQTPNAYYASEMRYPKKGGYKAFLQDLRKDSEIHFNKKVVQIDPKLKQLTFEDGSTQGYDILVSSLPLPELAHMVVGAPPAIKNAAKGLLHTSAYLVSLGFNKPNIPKHLWFYIYDENILPARVYSPSLKSPDNAPAGCSSFQAEIYFTQEQSLAYTQAEVLEKTISDLIDMGLFSRQDLVVQDIRLEKYANVVFTHGIYETRDLIRTYLNELGIYTIGRFGEWDYFWSDQSLLSGCQAADSILQKMQLR